ncbi:MAG TPA: DnaJ domain-containing protein [Noviherbaspirillum sp.]|nr:DnaJ domain-containing protein [Noviherbaspirillum sp.]
MKTLYDVLGVDRHASFADIEHSYRQNLNEHISSNTRRGWRKKDQLRLQQMRQAYLLLSSPRKRLEYDLRLNELEHTRLRRIERVSTGIGLALLLAGLAIIGHSYYRQVYGDMPDMGPAASVSQPDTVLVSQAVSEQGATQSPQRPSVSEKIPH